MVNDRLKIENEILLNELSKRKCIVEIEDFLNFYKCVKGIKVLMDSEILLSDSKRKKMVIYNEKELNELFKNLVLFYNRLKSG